MKILIVDDIRANAMLLKSLMARIDGAEIEIITNPVEALKWCAANEPDLVLLDYMMPEMDGVAFLRRLRRMEHLDDAPVIMITAEESPETLYEALNAGANDFLKKPVDAIELTARTRNMMQLRTRQLELARANAALERLANTDALTDVANRRAFLAALKREMKRAARYKSAIALAMMDIDFFKRVNDAYGHQAGDEVLKAVAAAAVGQVRQTDLVGRVGGEEFALLMPESDAAAGACVAERLRAGVEALRVDTAAGAISVTISIGVTAVLSHAGAAADTAETALSRADKALYQAKAEGRNRVTEI